MHARSIALLLLLTQYSFYELMQRIKIVPHEIRKFWVTSVT